MTLEELGRQYLQRDEILRRRARELRPGLQELRGDAYRQMEARIRSLYDSAKDCREIGVYLTTYYERRKK